ncbi:heterogeneous nuclear ribonucleoprotein 1-like [Forsythia ovata]|uniref:Heterogeneous nuclear ribonucleoprotein 1-like n=1 Tax=Forsythia ovata TaxID=205694 RepID=A0ABD1QAF4_9LAMI
MYDNVTHRPRGFGFITFDSKNCVEEIMQKKFHELSGKLVEVKRVVPKDGNSSNSDGYGRMGYPYGDAIYGGGYGEIGYGLTPIALWSSPTMVGVRGSFFPYGSDAPVNPTYFTGGAKVMGMSANGYYGILGSGFDRKTPPQQDIVMSGNDERMGYGCRKSGQLLEDCIQNRRCLRYG